MKARLIFLALSAVIVLGAFALFGGEAGDVEAPGPVKIAVATDLRKSSMRSPLRSYSPVTSPSTARRSATRR